MKKNVLLFLTVLAFATLGCSDDDSHEAATIQAAFVNQERNVLQSETEVSLVFSSAVPSAGTILLNVIPTNLVYGTDFTTNPAVVTGTIAVPFSANATSATFTFTKIIDAIEGEVKNVKFTIASISLSNIVTTATTNYTQLNFNETAVQSNTSVAENGGNAFPNGVYIDLSSGQETASNRIGWDLGFYSGAEFRVVLNPGINGFAVKQLATTNIDEVQVEDASVTTGNYDPAGAIYVDNPSGKLTATAIAEISATDADNKVYLVNLGQNISDVPAAGAGADFSGAARGWKKIRILRSGADYKLQYADIDATTHNEITISKNPSFTHTSFSFTTNTLVTAAPLQAKWDLLLTPYIGYTAYAGGNVSYFFGDGVLLNNLGGTKAYQVMASETSYANFTLTHVVAANFETPTASERNVIGTNWRVTYPSASVRTDRFYVVQDSAGNIYKIKFNSLLSTSGTRGTTTFEYVKLN